MDLRCSVASEADGEPLAGTAPTETDWLFVEDPGPWPAKATGHLSGLAGRAQLVRRYGRPEGRRTPGVRVFRATLGAEAVVRTAVVDDVREVAGLTDRDLTPYDGPLWLVCTNGRRDVCCAERGRPVAAALSEEWPEATWETTHLGGHRFSATLLALPGAHTLGRLDPASAVAACRELAAGRVPVDVSRGRSGWPPRAQWADLHLRERHGWAGLHDVRLVGVDGDAVTLDTPDGRTTLAVTQRPGEPRPQSCGDDKRKPSQVFGLEPPGTPRS